MSSPSSTFAALCCVLGLACAPYTTGDIGQDDTGGDTGGDTGVNTSTGTSSGASTESGTASATDSDPSTTTGNDSYDSGETASDTGSDFVATDGGGLPCGEECDIWNPDGCPEGEKCTAVACEVGGTTQDSNVCREVQGTAIAGDECMPTDGSTYSGNDNCVSGSICFDFDEDQLGTCIAFCTGTPETPECAEGESCTTYSSIYNASILPLCRAQCDPLAQDCLPATDSCQPTTPEAYVCLPDIAMDMAPYASPCQVDSECNSGLLCLEEGSVPESGCDSSNCCSPMCSIAAALPCPGVGQTCEPVFMTQPMGYEDVGVCTLP